MTVRINLRLFVVVVVETLKCLRHATDKGLCPSKVFFSPNGLLGKSGGAGFDSGAIAS